EGKTFQINSMIQVGRASGMMTLNDALSDLVKKNLITAEEAVLRAVDKTGMDALLKRAPVK
ncbi:MAG: type IV pilus twitching motility protein PilT, partial [Vicinamibacterales bacterium]